jgi:hypothetical protein
MRDDVDERLDEAQRIDFLWKVIARYDTYISATNTKASFIVALNSFMVGTILVKWNSIVSDASGSALRNVLHLALGATAVCAAVAVVLCLLAVAPYLRTKGDESHYLSAVFFGDVAMHSLPGDYRDYIVKATRRSLAEDLSFQAHALAGGLAKKFRLIKAGMNVAIFGQVPALIVLGVAILIARLGENGP